MLSILTAPLNVNVIICGTWDGSMLPGIRVPSDEQKQSGIVHWLVSHSGARFGSKSTAIIDTHTHTGKEQNENQSQNRTKFDQGIWIDQIRLLTAGIFIWFVFTVWFVITEQFFLDTFTVTALQFTLWTNWFVSFEIWHRFTWLFTFPMRLQITTTTKIIIKKEKICRILINCHYE